MQRKPNVGEPGVLQPVQDVGLLCCRGNHCFGQSLISLRRDGCDQIRFIPKVPIRRVVRDPCAAGNFTKGESRWSDLPDQADGGIQESLS